MALPKTLTRIEEKLDRVLALLADSGSLEADGQQPTASSQQPATLDPVAVAQLLDYDSYNAKEIIERAPSLLPEQKAALLIYEQAHAARKTVLEALG